LLEHWIRLQEKAIDAFLAQANTRGLQELICSKNCFIWVHAAGRETSTLAAGGRIFHPMLLVHKQVVWAREILIYFGVALGAKRSWG
jgi:hypothetical protein